MTVFHIYGSMEIKKNENEKNRFRVCEPVIDSYVLLNPGDNPQLAKHTAGLRT
jgi:hypothetical protein